jgi:hypothetical protein
MTAIQSANQSLTLILRHAALQQFPERPRFESVRERHYLKGRGETLTLAGSWERYDFRGCGKTPFPAGLGKGMSSRGCAAGTEN